MSRGQIAISPNELMRARQLRGQNKSWSEIGKIMDRHCETVRRAIDPEYALMRRAQINAWRRTAPSKKPDPLPNMKLDPLYVVRMTIPVEVIADRDRRADLPRTIHMALLGDPPPGRSALDRR